MNQKLLDKIEDGLYPVAKGYTPLGSAVTSVIHQWIHAISTKSALFAANRGANKENVRQRLKRLEIYKDIESFNKKVERLRHFKEPNHTCFRFIDLFAGIGGMRLGLQQSGGVCVFSSEYEKNAQKTYLENFGEYPFGDITNINERDIPDHDLLAAGFPCQPFSHAGLKLGIDDTRGTLFFDIARILKGKRPKVALLENVRGLVSHNRGHTLRVILNTLLNIGYRSCIDDEIVRYGKTCEIQKAAKKMIFRSRDFGVPQNRQRIFIVLLREDINTIFKYPAPTMEKTCVGDILEKNPDPKYTISDKLWAGHTRRKKENKKNGKGFGYGIFNNESEYTNTISARYYKDGSEALIEQPNRNPRKISPREAARLQGFPEKYVIHDSDVQAYKQFGNSVTVSVVAALGENISKLLKR